MKFHRFFTNGNCAWWILARLLYKVFIYRPFDTTTYVINYHALMILLAFIPVLIECAANGGRLIRC